MRLLIALVCLVFVAGCTSGKDAVASGTDFEFVSPGGKIDITYDGADRKQIPAISGESLLEDGKEIKLSDYADKVVVLNIWGAWCPPCRVEAPELQKVYDQTRESGVVVLGIDVRDHQRSAPQDFVRNSKITYPSIYDAPARTLLSLKGYPRSVVPSTIILDRAHRVAAIHLRPIEATDLLPTIKRLTEEPR
jgi:thiol-disulfide isomerase/thioredoxin